MSTTLLQPTYLKYPYRVKPFAIENNTTNMYENKEILARLNLHAHTLKHLKSMMQNIFP